MSAPQHNQGEDSDHDDHGSVITYKEDDEELREPRTIPLIITDSSPKQERDQYPPSKTEVAQQRASQHEIDEEMPMVRLKPLFRLRVSVGDMCDSNVWEFCLVFLGVVFVILTVAEVSVYSGAGIGTFEALKGLSSISAALLGVFTAEILLKSVAYDMGYWRVPRNSIESLAILVAFGVQVATVQSLFTVGNVFVTGQLTIASRVFRLIVCILRQRRTREYYTAYQALRTLNDTSLTTSERTLSILREIRSKYPLSDIHQVQLQWCINVIATHRLYSGFFRGPNGEPIKFEGMDEDTSKWLLGTYSKAGEDAASSVPPNGTPLRAEDLLKEGATVRNVASPPQTVNEKGSSLSLASASAPNVLKPTEGKLTRSLSRRDTDGADALLAGRRHTPLYLAADKSTTGTDPHSDSTTTYSTQGANSPLLSQKRTGSRASLLSRSADALSSANRGAKQSNLRRGSSFANTVDMVGDVEEGSLLSVNAQRILAGPAFGLTVNDLDILDAAIHSESPIFAQLGSACDTINRELDEWGFDIFAFNDLAKGRPLSSALLGCLKKGALFESMGNSISASSLIQFAVEIENGYNIGNPYHNRIHAADVVQCFHYFLTHRQFRDSLTPLDRFVGLVAAAIHDYRHPGRNNAFLIATRDPVAVQYNDISVLENMHVASAFQLMRSSSEFDIFGTLPTAGRAEARETMIQMILATDMKAHFDILSQFKNQVLQAQSVERTHDNLGAWWNELFPGDKDHSFSSTSSAMNPLTAYPLDFRRTILKTGLHVADVSNPVRPNVLAVKWAGLVQEEFYLQGDMERREGLPISMFMDRHKPAFPKMQVGFIEFIVKPLAESFYSWLKSLRPVVEPHLLENLEYWKRRLETESSATAGANQAALPPPAPAPSSPADPKVSNKFVARFKGGSAHTRHRSAASFGEITGVATPNMESASPSLGTKRPVTIRRSTSETFSPALSRETATKRRNPSPMNVPDSQSPSQQAVEKSFPVEPLGDSNV